MQTRALKILVVDDDPGLRLSLKTILATNSLYSVDEAFDGINAIEKIKAHDFDAVILDVDLPRMDGLEALRQIKEYNPGIIVLMVTAYAAIENAVQAVKDGAYNFLSKPVESQELLRQLTNAFEAHDLISKLTVNAPVLMEGGRRFIGSTEPMRKVFNIIHRLSKVDTPVLIRGASGTGKELVARAIHFNSARKQEKFVAINCSAIPENLFESELFGHEKGAFTGADQRKIGKFQYAEGGTLFLDEVGDMPLHLQVKLLRVLQEKVFTPVGANREIPTNVRVVAATNRPLEDMIQKGTFRDDLFYRLNVIPIFLPSLTERKDDLESLIHIFIKKFNEQHSRRVLGISQDALVVLKRYDWPGNIREVENVVEHMFIMENSNQLTITAIPETILKITGINLSAYARKKEDGLSPAQGLEKQALSSDSTSFEDDGSEELSFEESDLDPDGLGHAVSLVDGDSKLDFNAEKEAFEKEFIIKALKMFRGRINQTALHANIPKKTLLRKIEKYGINAKDYSA